MAAASCKGLAIAGSFGKRLIINQICAAKHCDAAMLLISRRASDSSSHYDKDIDENVSPVVVPDHEIGTRSEYWGPDPTTGVFGPGDPNAGVVATGSGHPVSPESRIHGSSVLDETVRFRQELEDPETEDQK